MADRPDPVVIFGIICFVLAILFVVENALIVFAGAAWLLWKFPVLRIVTGIAFVIIILMIVIVRFGSGPLRKKK